MVLDGMNSSDVMPDVGECIGVTGHFWAMQHQTNGCFAILSSKVAVITGIRSF
jgi:hypothetical protein